MSEDADVRRLARAVRERGLLAPVRLIVDAHRPIGPLVGSAATVLGPLLGALLGRRADATAALLERGDGLERLLAVLDQEAAAAEEPCPRQAS